MHHAQNLDGHANELGATVSLDYCFMTPDEEEEDMSNSDRLRPSEEWILGVAG